jgi:prenyltransferase beta subunit
MAMCTLAACSEKKHGAALAKARSWFERTEAESVLDAAATLLALADSQSPEAERRRDQCWQLIRRGQSPDGGWGPFVNARSEVFDTALVVLALSAQQDKSNFAKPIERGRGYLVKAQEADGGWPATTRPSGVDSYAERISTSGWALQALLATRGDAKPRPAAK